MCDEIQEGGPLLARDASQSDQAYLLCFLFVEERELEASFLILFILLLKQSFGTSTSTLSISCLFAYFT